jgi:hypothetical protein
MGSRRRDPGATRAGRLVRGRRLDRNPLRRACDRAETIAAVLLIAVFLAGAPLAAWATGAWAHGRAQRAELAQAASRHQVPAAVLAVPAVPTAGTWNVATVARARWTAPDGRVVTSELTVPDGTTAGASLGVWTTRAGRLTPHPLSRSQVAVLTVAGGLAGAAAIALALALAGVLFRRSLDRRRMAAWDADWQATGPRWTTRA